MANIMEVVAAAPGLSHSQECFEEFFLLTYCQSKAARHNCALYVNYVI